METLSPVVENSGSEDEGSKNRGKGVRFDGGRESRRALGVPQNQWWDSTQVLVLDEATASVDAAVDATVAAALAAETATRITIAHRLPTILGGDAVAVLEGGRLAEYGPPAALLADPASRFSAMCAAAGVDRHSLT